MRSSSVKLRRGSMVSGTSDWGSFSHSSIQAGFIQLPTLLKLGPT